MRPVYYHRVSSYVHVQCLRSLNRCHLLPLLLIANLHLESLGQGSMVGQTEGRESEEEDALAEYHWKRVKSPEVGFVGDKVASPPLGELDRAVDTTARTRGE